MVTTLNRTTLIVFVLVGTSRVQQTEAPTPTTLLADYRRFLAGTNLFSWNAFSLARRGPRRQPVDGSLDFSALLSLSTCPPRSRWPPSIGHWNGNRKTPTSGRLSEFQKFFLVLARMLKRFACVFAGLLSLGLLFRVRRLQYDSTYVYNGIVYICTVHQSST